MGALQDPGHCDQHRNNSQPNVVSRTGGDSEHRLCLLSDKGAGFPTVDCPRAVRGARPRARSRPFDAARTALDLPHSSHVPEPGTTSIQPQACTNFGTSTSTGLDSHVASNCRLGKQVATASKKAGVGQCLTGEHRMSLPRMYRPLGQGLRLERAGPVLATSRTTNQVVLARRSTSSADIWPVHRQRPKRPPRQVCETGFWLDRLRTLSVATAVCASRGNTIWSM